MVLNFPLESIGKKGPHKYLTAQNQQHTPADLAEVAYSDIEELKRSGVHWHRSYTKEDFTALLTVAFFASLSTYEGRTPRCSILVDHQPYGETCGETSTLTFASAPTFNVDQLRKLAPLCQSGRSAIRIEKQGSSLRVAGLSAVKFEDATFDLGFLPPRRQIHRESNVKIHILAPGRIRVDNGIFEYELECGRIRQCLPLWSLTRMREVCQQFSASVNKLLAQNEKLSAEQRQLIPLLGNTMRCEFLVARILQQIVASGFGGAILVVPSERLPELQTQLHTLKNDKGIELFDAVVEFGLAALLCRGGGPIGLSLDEPKLQRLAVARADIILAAKTIADLCAVDGCVVLDEQLRVHGFGVKINTTDEDAIRSNITFRRSTDGSSVELEELEKLGGTRWRSALWFCKANKSVTGFVISQDRNLRICWSDQQNAYGYGPLQLPTPDYE